MAVENMRYMVVDELHLITFEKQFESVGCFQSLKFLIFSPLCPFWCVCWEGKKKQRLKTDIKIYSKLETRL